MSIVAAVTAGDVDHLVVGRNGLFYDRAGKDWAATITKIVDAPISIREAFWSPYKKAIRAIEDRLARRAAQAEAAADARVASVVDRHATAIEGGAPAGGEPATGAPRIDVGTVAAIGVAIGGITAALGSLLQSIFGLGVWMPLGVLALMLAISGPSMAVAWLKLRTRNLGPLLDANGWAVNAQARLNVPLGESLTRLAELPPGARHELRDPFEERRSPWRWYIAIGMAIAVGIAWYAGFFDEWLPERARSTAVLGRAAPAYHETAKDTDAAERGEDGP